MCKSFGQTDLLQKGSARLPYNSQKQLFKGRAVMCHNQTIFRKIPPQSVVCFFSFTFESQAHCTAPLCTGKFYVFHRSGHVLSQTSFTYRPDLLLPEIIGKVPITCREISLENWRTTGVLSRFEEARKYSYLDKGKSVSLLLHVL